MNNNSIKLAIGDVISVESFKTVASQKYPGKMYGKILCGDGVIRWTSAAKIIKILTAIGENTGDQFEVYQAGEYNGYPILSLKSRNPTTQKKIEKIFF